MGKNKHVNIPSSILIATFSLWKDGKRTASNGILDPMLYFFTPRTKDLVLIDQPYPGSDRTIPTVEHFKKNKINKKSKTLITAILTYPFLKMTNKPGTHLFFKIRDFFSVLEVGIMNNKKFGLFIGLESINAAGGIILRKLGKVNKVVYYVSDYSPKRFKIKMVNDLYLLLDRFCAENADFVWDVSSAMQKARVSAGLDYKKSAPVIHAPNALYENQLISMPYDKRDPYSIVFVGTLGLENGPDVAVKSMPYVVEAFPQAKLHIFGGGGKGFEMKLLENLTNKFKIKNNVVFHDFISDQKKLSETIKHYKIGIAPYKNIPGSIRLYGDATKLRLYMAAGLPVITTAVPPLGKELAAYGSAFLSDDNEKKIGEAIISILKNKKLGNDMSVKAIRFAKDNTWKNTYTNALKKMGY